MQPAASATVKAANVHALTARSFLVLGPCDVTAPPSTFVATNETLLAAASGSYAGGFMSVLQGQVTAGSTYSVISFLSSSEGDGGGQCQQFTGVPSNHETRAPTRIHLSRRAAGNGSAMSSTAATE